MSGRTMGPIIGMVIGGAIGALFPYGIGIGPGMAIGGAIGGIGGALYDTATAPDIRHEQENIGDFFIQTSTLGSAIPQLIGNERLSGNVFYIGERFVVEHEEEEEGGGKGGASGPITVTKTYEVDLAIGLCDTRIFGQVSGIRKIWRDGTVWNSRANGSVGSGGLPDGVTFYNGTLDQLPDPTMEAVKGVGNVPGYPYLCYVMLDNYDMGNYPRVPTFTFELHQDQAPLIAGQQLTRQASTGNILAAAPATNEVLVFDPITQDVINTILVSDALPYSTVRGFIMGWQSASILWLAHPRDYTLNRVNVSSNAVSSVAVNYSLLSGGLLADGDMWFCAYHYTTKVGYLVRVDGPPASLVATITCGQAQGGEMKATVGLDGDVWVTDNHYSGGGGNSNALRVSPASNTVTQTISLGTAATRSPIDILAGADGDIWVLDAQANNVRRISPASNTIIATVSLSATPLQLGLANDGYVWAATTLDGGTVYRINPATNTAQAFDSLDLTLPSPAHQLFEQGPSGSMWVLSVPTWTVQLIDTAGVATLRNLDGEPRGMVAESTTHAWTIDTTGRVAKTANTGLSAVATSSQIPRLRAVITALCGAAGLTPDDIDVSTIPNPTVAMKIVNVVAVKAPLEDILQAYQLFAYESNLQIVFKERDPGAIVATITEGELDAHDGTAETPASQGLAIKRLPDDKLPTELRLSYISRTRNYQQQTQPAYMTTSRAPVTNSRAISLPLVLGDAQGIRLAREALDQIWIGRTQYRFTVNRDYAYLEPGDRITVTSRGVTHTMILSEVNYGRPGLMECVARSDIAGAVNVLSSHTPGVASSVQRMPVAANTIGQLINLPAMTTADQFPRYHVAYQHVSSTWPGASLHRSVDSGTTYAKVDSDWRIRGTVGTVATPIGDASDWYLFDDVNTFTVVLVSGALQSVSDDELYDESNMVMIGNEVLQPGIAILIAPLTYTCSHLLRGRRGTEWATTGHAADERFVLINASVRPVPMIASDRNVPREFKTVTGGVNISAVTPTTFSATSENLKPWAITDAEAVRVGANWAFTWTARSRFSGGWADEEPFGYDTDFLLFRVFIYSDATYATRVRTFHIIPTIDPASVQSFTYTAAQESVDFGSPQSVLYYRIAQIGSYGVGRMENLTGVS